MKQCKRLKKVLVLLLCAAMLLPFSLQASATNEPVITESTTENGNTSAGEKTLTTEGSSAANSSTVFSKEGLEVVALREENVKHFDMGNGNYTAISYSHPVHELDSEGNWQDIDFTMNLTQTRGVSTYTNTAGTTFAETYTPNQPLMSMDGEDTFLDMTIVCVGESLGSRSGSLTTAKAEFTRASAAVKTYAEAQNVDFSNTLYYENVMPGVDLEYIVDPWNVKENIIVKEKANTYAYKFKLNLDGMYPVLQKDGSIFILNEQTEEQEYLIPAPYMYDANGEMSFDVSYTITGNNGTYYLTVTADDSWINAEERVFPITIDPSIYQSYQSVNMDTYINEDTPNEARGAYRFFFVGENEVAYLYTPTPVLPEGAIFGAASLNLHYFYKDHITTGYVDFTAHRVTDFYWSEEELTWNSVVNNPNYANYGLTPTAEGSAIRVHAAAYATSASPKPISVNVTDAVRLWLNGTSNKGIGLMYEESSSNRSVMFRSTEGHVDYRPVLQVSYVLYKVNLILEYDPAYGQRALDGKTASQWIKEEAEELAEFFYNYNNFHIVVQFDEPEQVTTYADQCEGTGRCTCEGKSCIDGEVVETNHHSNIYAIVTDLEIPNPTSTRMVYIGRDICYNEICSSSDNLEPTIYGLAHIYNYTMAIHDHRSKENETITAIHEMGHMFGAEDHYGVGEETTAYMQQQYPNDGYDENCLYGEGLWNMNDVDDIVICNGCQKRIFENRSRFND